MKTNNEAEKRIKPIKLMCGEFTFDIHDYIGDSLDEFMDGDFVDAGTEIEFCKASKEWLDSMDKVDEETEEKLWDKYSAIQRKYNAEVIRNFFKWAFEDDQ